MKPLNKIFILLILFISIQLRAETYWTSERIFDICDKYSDIIAFDSSENLNVFWRETKYEDAFPGSRPPMKFLVISHL
ncbi:hypothetical protein KAX75_05985 [candidate division WOR-3 bacterium]|nr:hypothetical protein [candidate division WOR-3 bacterium]